MNFQRRNRMHSEISTGALTDIMFFLLLFFLIVSTVANPNVIKLMLPQSSPSSDIAKKTLAVSITKDLVYYIDKDPIEESELRNRIAARAQELQEPTLVLRVEQGVAVEHLVKVLDIGMQLKLKVVLQTERI
jgi:biopolymer transport protein ExbD